MGNFEGSLEQLLREVLRAKSQVQELTASAHELSNDMVCVLAIMGNFEGSEEQLLREVLRAKSQVQALTASAHELSNDMVCVLAMMGNFEGSLEQLLREVMRVDKCSYSEAATKVKEMAQGFSKVSYWLSKFITVLRRYECKYFLAYCTLADAMHTACRRTHQHGRRSIQFFAAIACLWEH